MAAMVDREDPETHEMIPAAWREELGESTLTELQALAGKTSREASCRENT